jgi:positive regulator of sigma E activity
MTAVPDAVGLPDALRDDPQAAVAFLTTEHFNLQTARSATISETNGRASVFLGAVSAGLVAIAFAGQASQTTLYTLGLVLFPVLSFLGLVTFERALQASIEDTHLMLRINRIRRFYVEAAPQLAPYLAQPSPTDTVGAIMRTEGFRSRWQLMVSIVGAIGVLDSVLLGVTVGFAVAALTGDELWAATPVGLVVFAVSVSLHQRYQKRRRERAHELSDMFPPDP